MVFHQLKTMFPRKLPISRSRLILRQLRFIAPPPGQLECELLVLGLLVAAVTWTWDVYLQQCAPGVIHEHGCRFVAPEATWSPI